MEYDPRTSCFVLSAVPRETSARCAVHRIVGILELQPFRTMFTVPAHAFSQLKPKVLADALFDAFGALRRGEIALDEFMCAMAVMHRGTAPEQLRMLFEVQTSEPYATHHIHSNIYYMYIYIRVAL